MIRFLLPIFFYSSPKFILNGEQIDRYAQMEHRIRNNQANKEGGMLHLTREETLRFLFYLSQQKQYVFHGSNHLNIEQFEPREQTLYDGQLTKAVFASSDPYWAAFFAVLNRERLRGGFRNGCLVGRKRTYHFYSLNESTMKNDPWTEGGIYILPKERFHLSGNGKLRFDEWICYEPVTPLGMIKVNQEHFYFINKVAIHGDNEPIAKTWLFYKLRTMKARRLRG